MKEQHYNDSAFDYFILFLLTVITLPSTWVFVRARMRAGKSADDQCACRSCTQREAELVAQERKLGPGTIIKIVVLVVLWFLLLNVVINVATRTDTSANTHFDPYAVLGLEPGAPMDAIRRAYRNLSILYHPDKAENPDDPEVVARFINVNKAYETLTDDAIREKWEKYGNPDGPQAISVGIALPSWLVRKDNTFAVLSVYLIMLVVGVPAAVGYWWRSWKKFDSNSKVMNNTMGLYYHTLEPVARVKHIIEVIGASEEFKEIPMRSSDEKLEKVLRFVPDTHTLKRKPKFNVQWAIKSQLLLFAQICRRQADLTTNQKADLDFILAKIRSLVGGIITICTARQYFWPVIEGIQLLQSVTQCAWKENPLLQLPHFDEYAAGEASSRRFGAHDVTTFANLPADKRTEFYLKMNFNSGQIADIDAALKTMPTQMQLDYSCSVEGEDTETIVCRAVVTLTYTVTRTQGLSQEQIEAKKKLKEADRRKRLVHAPLFPERREECWWVVIGDPRGGQNNAGSLVGISKVGCVDDVVEGKIKFMAPPTEGAYGFIIFLMCDGYIGFDKKSDIRLKVVRDEVAEKERAAQAEKDKQRKARKTAQKAEKAGKEVVAKEGAKDKEREDEEEEDDSDDSSFYSDSEEENEK